MRALYNAFAATALAFAVAVPPASAAPPGPCGTAAQIADPEGDGHHKNTDVTAAWLTESAGRLQAVVKVDFAIAEPAHEDSDDAGIALLYRIGGETRYVRATLLRGAPPAYDHGTWTASGGFASAGATTGESVEGSGGTVTLDVPPVAAGTVLAQPFVLTYDGGTGADKHWVDRAPGGNTPDGTEFGADYVTGSCSGTPAVPVDPQVAAPVTTTAIDLRAPKKLTGSGTARVTGTVSPARGGVPVEITANRVTRRVTTAADGTFSAALAVTETTRVRAVAEGRGSQTLTVRMYSRVRIKLRRLPSGAVVVTGTTSPKLGGRVLWLRSDAVQPSARTTARGGRFTLRLAHPRKGRYQAVFIPSGARAERSTSNTGTIR